MSLPLLREIVRLVESEPEYQAVAPGGIWLNEAPSVEEGTRRWPVVVFQAMEDDPEYDTGRSYLTRIMVQITAVDASDEQRAIHAASWVSRVLVEAARSGMFNVWPDHLDSAWRSSGQIVDKQRMEDGDVWISVRTLEFLMERDMDHGD